VDDPQVRAYRSEVPWWILAVIGGVLFGVAMGLPTKLDGSSWTEAGVGALVTGIPFGLAMGWWSANWQAGMKEAEGDLPTDKVELAHQAAAGGPEPVDAEIRSAALSIASLRLAQYAGKTRRLSIVMMVLLLIGSVVGAVTDSLWVLVPALFFGVLLFWQWYLPRQIRRRIKLLSGTTTASAD
jgi:Flp pilus assembly protein TadB